MGDPEDGEHGRYFLHVPGSYADLLAPQVCGAANPFDENPVSEALFETEDNGTAGFVVLLRVRHHQLDVVTRLAVAMARSHSGFSLRRGNRDLDL